LIILLSIRYFFRTDSRLILICSLFCLFSLHPSQAQLDRLSPEVYGAAAFDLPGDDLYTPGVSARTGISISFLPTKLLPDSLIPAVSARTGIDSLSIPDTARVLLFPVSLGPEINWKAGQRTKLTIYTGAGGYIAPVFDSPYENIVAGGPLIEADLNIRRQILPRLAVGLNAGWSWHIGALQVWSFGPSLHYSVSPSAVLISPGEMKPLFPTLYERYRNDGIGSIIISNTGDFPIQLVEVSCEAPPYTAGPTRVRQDTIIQANDSVRIPVRLTFGNRILGMVGDYDLTVRIIVSYRQGSGTAVKQSSFPIRILDRNSISWDDDAKACLFITEKDPAVRHFMGQIVGGSIGAKRPLVNRTFTLAVATLGAFKSHGLVYSKDPVSPYSLVHNPGTVDFLRFPRETLADKIGDCDDLTILYCALLESVGIETALVTVPGHIFAAVSLEIPYRDAVRLFSSWTDLIDFEGEAWLPVETTISEDIIKSWHSAADQYRRAVRTGEVGFIPVRSAWQMYPPVALETAGSTAPLLDPRAFADTLERMNKDVVMSEMEPLADDLLARIEGGTDDYGRAFNRLGVLYARYGQLEEARRAFTSAAYDDRYEPAMVNLGNLLLLLGDYRNALDLFEVYYADHPREPAAVLGISMARFRLREYGLCARAYEELERLDPEAAAANSYLVVRTLDEIDPSRATVQAGEVLWLE